MIWRLVIFFLLVSTVPITAQRTFSDQTFYQLVIKNHPLAKQANLELEIGRVGVLKAKGSFDPKAYNSLDQKYYNSYQYYSLLDAGLKIPTWYGLEFKGGVESNQGAFLNPEEKTPSSGLVYAGATVNIGKGLFIDERRAELFKAKVYYQSTFFEQKLPIVRLYFYAATGSSFPFCLFLLSAKIMDFSCDTLVVNSTFHFHWSGKPKLI